MGEEQSNEPHMPVMSLIRRRILGIFQGFGFTMVLSACSKPNASAYRKLNLDGTAKSPETAAYVQPNWPTKDMKAA